MAELRAWWSEDHKWFCLYVDDGNAKATVSLTPQQAGELYVEACAPPIEGDKPLHIQIGGEKRCANCDNPIDAQGKTIVDHACEDHDICPDCRGPLDQRRVYGLLS